VTGVGDDRLKRGLDNACYLAWGAWKVKHGESDDPGRDFHLFTLDRQQVLHKKEQAELDAIAAERKAKRR
jgi:hypothetical protein